LENEFIGSKVVVSDTKKMDSRVVFTIRIEL
jgi:hypothetical protein